MTPELRDSDPLQAQTRSRLNCVRYVQKHLPRLWDPAVSSPLRLSILGALIF